MLPSPRRFSIFQSTPWRSSRPIWPATVCRFASERHMLIPSIDLQGGRIVQLVQGEKLAVESTNIDLWIDSSRPYTNIQLIDLDAAKSEGTNDAIVRRSCAELPCRVGGGIRSVERAQAVLAGGATQVIVSSALFADGQVDLDFAARLAEAVGADRVIAAVDSLGGKVVIHGWRTKLDITAVDAVRVLEPYCDEFLYTHEIGRASCRERVWISC